MGAAILHWWCQVQPEDGPVHQERSMGLWNGRNMQGNFQSTTKWPPGGHSCMFLPKLPQAPTMRARCPPVGPVLVHNTPPPSVIFHLFTDESRFMLIACDRCEGHWGDTEQEVLLPAASSSLWQGVHRATEPACANQRYSNCSLALGWDPQTRCGTICWCSGFQVPHGDNALPRVAGECQQLLNHEGVNAIKQESHFLTLFCGIFHPGCLLSSFWAAYTSFLSLPSCASWLHLVCVFPFSNPPFLHVFDLSSLTLSVSLFSCCLGLHWLCLTSVSSLLEQIKCWVWQCTKLPGGQCFSLRFAELTHLWYAKIN